LKKPIFFTLIVILYLLTVACIIVAAGTMVSKKYEIDESYWKIDANRNLTSEQRRKLTDNLDIQGRQMEYKAYAFAFIALATSITATAMLVRRRYFLKRKNPI
jgi:hypothetical protein